MGKFLITVLLTVAITATGSADTFLELAGEISMPVPGGWSCDSTSDYPFQLVNTDSTAELLIFKSTINEDEIVTNDAELKLSVDQVIEDVILTMPDAELLTNTGYFEENRVSFAVEFLSTDTAQDLRLRHRLKGVIYKHPEGHQLLFSLWGKVAFGAPPAALDNLRLMQEGFVYAGEAQGKVFGKTQRTEWVWFAILAMMAAILFLLFKARRKAVGMRSAAPEHFWRCECGRLNHNDHATCGRCGRPSPEDITR